jgi:hypothetical protein
MAKKKKAAAKKQAGKDSGKTAKIAVVQKQILAEKKTAAVQSFLRTLLEKQFPAELSRYIGRVADLPWWYRERSLLGLLNNAVVRGDRSGALISLQEFSVSTDSKIGRSDLWVSDKKKKVDLLIESKYHAGRLGESERWTAQDQQDFLNRVIHQANTYYRAERRHYSKNTFAVALIFEAIGGAKAAARAKTAAKIMKDSWHKWDIKKAKDGTHFYYLYETDFKHKFAEVDEDYPWLAVYGSIQKLPLKEEKKKMEKVVPKPILTEAVPNADVD